MESVPSCLQAGGLSEVCGWLTGGGVFQVELDQEKGLEMRKWVLSGILASEETYLSHLEALLIVCAIQLHTLLGITSLLIVSLERKYLSLLSLQGFL